MGVRTQLNLEGTLCSAQLHDSCQTGAGVCSFVRGELRVLCLAGKALLVSEMKAGEKHGLLWGTHTALPGPETRRSGFRAQLHSPIHQIFRIPPTGQALPSILSKW